MSETRKLFVYGTLRPGARSHMGRGMRRRLARESRIVGPAVVPGLLFDLGRYPGLFEDDGAALVSGDVVDLAVPEATWRWLDAYEGFDPERPEAGEYRRVVRDVRSISGEVFAAWVYVLVERPRSRPIITSGDWLAR